MSVTETGRQVLEQMRELSARQLMSLCALDSDDDLEIVERATRIHADAALAAGSDPTRPSATLAGRFTENPS